MSGSSGTRAAHGTGPGRASAFLGLAVALALFAGLACGRPRFDGQEYRDGQLAFRLGPLPPGARELDSDESLIALRSDDAGASIAIGARCGLDGDDVPLRALLQHLFLQFTERSLLSERELELDGRDALEAELEAELDGVRRHFVVVVLKKDGCVYDFIHVDPGGDAPAVTASRRDFRAMVAGFHTID